MARATYDCARCGAAIVVAGRNRAAADHLAARHAAQGHVCSQCAASARAAENRRNTEAAAAAGMPPLTGSDKQVAWAETIRAGMIAHLDEALPWVARPAGVARIKAMREHYGLATDRHRLVAHHVAMLETAIDVDDVDPMLVLAALADVIRAQTSARWWIDHRDASYETILSSVRPQVIAALGPAPTPATAPSAAQAAAEAEALLRPAGPPASTQVAEVRHVGNIIRVHMPAKIEAFRLAMHAGQFRWADTHWERPLSALTGEPVDRVADIAHRLLAAGFMVRVQDDEARRRAAQGSFVPECTRWVLTLTAGEHAGKFGITWHRPDDYYAAARRIIGARWMRGIMVVPASSADEVADFAAEFGFAISPAAQALIDQHCAMLAAGTVVAAKPSAERPVRVRDTGKPAPLAPPTDAGVADELLDDD